MPAARYALCALGVVATTTLGATAHAQATRTEPAHIVAAVPGASGFVSGAILIGRGGERYVGDGNGAWRRAPGGGIAVDITNAVAVAGGTIYAMGERTPVFVHDGTTWRAENLPNRGTVTAGTGGHPTLAIGSHLYHRTGRAWRRARKARQRVRAVWAASPKRLYVVTSAGGIERLRGTRWNDVAQPLPTDDPVRWLAGSGGTNCHAVSVDGVVLRLGATRATVVPPPAGITALQVHAVASSTAGLLAAGVASGGVDRRAVLVRIIKTKMTVEAELPALATGDRYAAVLTDAKGDLLVATNLGALRLRLAGVWRDARIAAPSAPAPARPANGVGPAHTP